MYMGYPLAETIITLRSVEELYFGQSTYWKSRRSQGLLVYSRDATRRDRAAWRGRFCQELAAR